MRPASVVAWARIGACVAAAGLSLACGSEPPAAAAAPEVTVEKPARRSVQRYTEFTGTMSAIEEAEIRARVSGELQQIFFEPSSNVERGQVLFEIERGTYEAEQSAAVADLAGAEAELAKTTADLARVTEAGEFKAVSASEVDQARALRDQAQAAVLSARASLDRAEINLGYTRVESPIDGQVSRNLVDAGNLVGSSEPTLLASVKRIKPIHVYFDAPEELVLSFLELRKAGESADYDRVVVATANDEGFPHEGHVDYIDNTVDPGTGTIELRAELANDDAVLFPGLFVRIRLLGTRAEAILVNERAIGTDLSGKFVLIVGEGNVVEQRHVTLGPLQDDGSVVVDEGLEGDENYIVEGLLRARPGLPVNPQGAAAPRGPSESEDSSPAEPSAPAKNG